MVTKKLSKEQHQELFFILDRESKKLKQIFAEIKLIDDSFSQIFNLAKSYYQDMKHFFDKKEYVKSFELQNYVWGMLDSLAVMKAVQVPEEMQKWFKAEF
jgi:hypothetical protein